MHSKTGILQALGHSRTYDLLVVFVEQGSETNERRLQKRAHASKQPLSFQYTLLPRLTNP